MHSDHVFNNHKSRLMRTRIPCSENLSVALIALALIAVLFYANPVRSADEVTKPHSENSPCLKVFLIIFANQRVSSYC